MSARPALGMVLAAGLGTRMGTLSETVPKPLVQVAGKPLIAHVLERLELAGVAEIVVNTHHLAAQIEAFLADYAARPGALRIHISREDERLETGGGVRQALPWLGDDAFYVVNSDVVLAEGSAPALPRLAEAWDGETMDALLLLCPLARALGYDGAGDFFRHEERTTQPARSRRPPRPSSSPARKSCTPGYSPMRRLVPIRSTATTTRRSAQAACSGWCIAASCSTSARQRVSRPQSAISLRNGAGRVNERTSAHPLHGAASRLVCGCVGWRAPCRPADPARPRRSAGAEPPHHPAAHAPRLPGAASRLPSCRAGAGASAAAHPPPRRHRRGRAEPRRRRGRDPARRRLGAGAPAHARAPDSEVGRDARRRRAPARARWTNPRGLRAR